MVAKVPYIDFLWLRGLFAALVLAVFSLSPSAQGQESVSGDEEQEALSFDGFYHFSDIFIFVEDSLRGGSSNLVSQSASASPPQEPEGIFAPDLVGDSLKIVHGEDTRGQVKDPEDTLVIPADKYDLLAAQLRLNDQCRLSEFASTTQTLRATLESEALNRFRVPVEAWAPCAELLAFGEQNQPVSKLVKLEIMSFGPAAEVKGADFINQVREAHEDTHILGTSTLAALAMPLSDIPFDSRRALIDVGPGAFALLEMDRVQIPAAELEGEDSSLTLVALTGLVSDGEEVLILTANAGTDPNVSLSEIHALFIGTLGQVMANTQRAG